MTRDRDQDGGLIQDGAGDSLQGDSRTLEQQLAPPGSAYAQADLTPGIDVAEAGGTDSEIAAAIGIDNTTYRAWRDRYPDLAISVETARERAAESVAGALFGRAVGLIDQRKRKVVTDYKGRQEVTETVTTLPPSDAAIEMWLSNRGKDWTPTSQGTGGWVIEPISIPVTAIGASPLPVPVESSGVPIVITQETVPTPGIGHNPNSRRKAKLADVVGDADPEPVVKHSVKRKSKRRPKDRRSAKPGD